MAEGMTCYERDEEHCEDQMCLRVGCRLRNDRLGKTPERIWAYAGGVSVNTAEKPANGYFHEYIRADLVEPLVEALRRMVGRYVELVASGDAGFWDAEKEGEVITSRAALSSWEAAQ